MKFDFFDESLRLNIGFTQMPYRVVLSWTSTTFVDFYRHFIARRHFELRHSRRRDAGRTNSSGPLGHLKFSKLKYVFPNFE